MPTLTTLPAGAKVVVFPGNDVPLELDWDVTDSLTGRTFTSKLNGETVAVSRAGQVLSVTWPASITATLPTLSQWVLYETTSGSQARVAFDVVTKRGGNGSSTVADSVDVNVGTLTVTVTVIGQGGGGGGGGSGDMLAANNLSDVANTGTARSNLLTGMTSANLASFLTDETGSGAAVFATSPTLVTPALGTPSSVTLTNATGLPVSTGISGLGTAVATFLATPSSANLAAALTDETGTGSNVFATSPTLVTPILGTPTSGTLTNCTGLPISTGVSGLAANVATFLATPSSANLASVVTDETGSGALVFGTSPTIGTPTITTPTMTGGTYLNASQIKVNTTTGELTSAKLEVNGGAAVPMHVYNAFLGLSYVATQFSGGKSSLDLRSTQGASLSSLSPSLSGDILGAIHIGGSHNTATGLVDCAHQYAVATENFATGATASGTRWLWATTANLTEQKLVRFIIDHDGGLVIGAHDTTGGGAVSLTYAASTAMPTAHLSTRSAQTFTSTFATPTFPWFAQDAATYTIGAASPAAPFKRGFVHSATITNDAAISTNWASSAVSGSGFLDNPTLNVNTATGRNMGYWRSFAATPSVTRSNSGTFTAGKLLAFAAAPTVGAGITLDEVTGLSITDLANSGTVTTQYGVDIPALTGATTNWGMRSQTKVLFTAGIYGDTASGGDMTLQATSNSEPGSIYLFGADPTITALTVEPFLGIQSTRTITANFTSQKFPPTFQDASTRVFTTAGNSGAAPFIAFDSKMIVKNANAVVAHLAASASAVGGIAFRDANTVETDGASSVNLGNYYSFRAQPTATAINSGTWNASALIGFGWAPTITVGTIGTATGISLLDPSVSGGGALTTLRGLDIAAFSSATTNIGIRNMSTSRLAGAVTIGADAAVGTGLILDIQSGSFAYNQATLTYASPTSVDVSLANTFKVTTVNATGSVTFNATTGGKAGQPLKFIIVNDATSGKTITFGTNFKSTGTLAGTASQTRTVEFISDGTSWWEISRTAAMA